MKWKINQSKSARSNLKKLVIVLIIVLAISGSLGAYKINHRNSSKNLSSAQSERANETTKTEQDEPAIEPKPQTVATEQSKKATPQAAVPPKTTTVEPAPLYGEDSGNPGVYIIFKKDQVLTNAGVAAADFDYVKKLMGYAYRSESNTSINLFNVSPPAKMASAGEDYAINPTTQIKWANSYVNARYGNWATAADFYAANKFF